MSTKTKLLQQISNFIEELNTTFPNNNDIEMFKEKFLFLKSVNSQLIIEYFIKFLDTIKETINKLKYLKSHHSTEHLLFDQRTCTIALKTPELNQSVN